MSTDTTPDHSDDTVRSSQRCVILGAGFSTAINAAMPLTQALGETVVRQLAKNERATGLLTGREEAAVARGKVPLANLEVWLSSLASAQPHHDRAERLRRSALFEIAASCISVEIARCEHDTLAASCPEWLSALVVALHYDRSAVITFNYDTLIEATLHSLSLWGLSPDGRKINRVMAHSVLGDLPPRIQLEGHRYGPLYAESFRVHKLHGSTTWFSQRGATGASIVRDDRRIGRWGAPINTQRPPRSGMENMIVPPVADKSDVYSNASVSGIWLEAAAALRAAGEVVLAGYSLPLTDYSASALLAENTGPDTSFTVVNPDPESVIGRLQEVAPGGPVCASESVEEFVEAFVARVAAEQIIDPDTLAGPEDSSAIAVGPDSTTHAVLRVAEGVLQLGPSQQQRPLDPGPPVLIEELGRARHARRGDGAIAPVFAVAKRQSLGEPITLHTGVFRTGAPTPLQD